MARTDGLGECGYGSSSDKSQWFPEETTWAALAKRQLDEHQHEPEALEFFKTLVASHTK